MTANRLAGAAVLAFGLALFFLVIPAHTERVDYGWLRPDTLPNVLAVILALCGAVQVLLPAGRVDADLAGTARVCLFAAVVAGGIWLLDIAGFEIAAPLLALAIMLMIGERRIGWLAAGSVLAPAAIWTCVELLLHRPLP